MNMKLMYAPPSPFARKVRAAAIELGLDDQIELELTEVAPGRANAAYAAGVNPLRKIPALVLDDGGAIYDSTVICEFLDAQAGGGRIIPRDGPERWRVLTRHALAQGMCEAAVLIRYETWLRPAEARWQTWVDDQWDKLRAGLGWFAAEPDALEGPVDVAQIALGCLLGYLDFRYADFDWRARHPDLGDWFAVLSRRESFAATVPAPPPTS